MGALVLLADRYALDELLGRGAMGDVWRATDRLLVRPVAVKVLRMEETADTERFRLEARIAGRLNHPNVVGVYDFGAHHDGRPYLVMELVDGWSLAQERSLRGALPPYEAAGLAAQMAAGLTAAHQQGVIHRDIKPANAMVTTDGTVKITDFGIARFADEAAGTATATGKVLGTADYLAPERALGRPARPSVDMYSLGCVLYELLTGRPPFQGATSLAVVQQHVDAAPLPPVRLRAETPRPLSDYVLCLLAKDPVARPGAAEAADWLGALAQRSASGERTASTAYRRVPITPAEPGGVTAHRPVPPPPSATAGPAADTAHRSVALVGSAPHTGPSSVPSPSVARASRSRPRGRGRLAVKAAVGAGAVALFAGAAALGATLDSGDVQGPSTPVSATSSAVASAPPDGTGTARAPSADSNPTAPSVSPATTGPHTNDHQAAREDKPKGMEEHTKGHTH